MKSKYLLLAAALFIACGDDSSSSPANDTPANDTPAQNGNGDNHRAEPSYTDCIQTVFEFARIRRGGRKAVGIFFERGVKLLFGDIFPFDERGHFRVARKFKMARKKTNVVLLRKFAAEVAGHISENFKFFHIKPPLKDFCL